MKLLALRLYNVRRFANRGVALEGIGAGVNVLCARNEFGKSTSFDALHALFFQPHTGTPGPVQALRPYSGGSPRVEADIETATGRFRIAKQYYGGRAARVMDLASGRLIAQADEAERFIAEQVHGGAGGPAGLLWVRQGITGIDRRPKTDEETEKRARESVLTSVQGEVEALTGGRRMAGIMAACEAELDKYVTATGRPKANGAYAEAIARHEGLAEEVARLGAEVEALREALDERRRVRARLAEIEDAEATATRREALEQAQAALETARAHGEKLHLARTQADLARAHADKARGDLEAFEAALARARALDATLEAAARTRDTTRARQDEATAALEGARLALESAEREEKEARALFIRLERALRARAAAERRDAMARTLEKAEAAREAIETGEARMRLLAVPEKHLAALQALEAEIERLQAGAMASAPSLELDRAEGESGAIDIAGEPLVAGRPRALSGTTRIDIAGVGRLTITAPIAPAADALALATRKRDDLLAELDLPNLAEVRRRSDKAGALKADLALEHERLAIHAPDGLAALREAAARLAAEAETGETAAGDPDALRARHEAAEAALEAQRHRLRALEPTKAAADKAALDAQGDWAALSRERTAIEETLGAGSERDERLDVLRRAEAAARTPHEAAREAHDALLARAPDLDSAEASVSRLRSALDAAAKEGAGLRERLAGLDERIRARADDAVEEAWREAVEALGRAEAERDRIAHEVSVLTLLRDTLMGARSDAREHYFEPVMRELRPLLSLLFEGADVAFDEGSLLPRTVVRNGQAEEIERLSGGMREQLAVMTRLAFARLLARDGRPAPVILDDALVYSDDDRIERMFDALHRQARDQQIIVFSCRQRAFASLGGNVLSMTDWTPEA